MRTFTGTAAALVTPFTENGQVDFDALGGLLEHTSSHLDFLVVSGTTAESATLSFEEKQAVLKYVVNNNPHNRPIMFGVGGNDTNSVIERIEKFDLEGVDGILSVCPYYVRPTQEGIKAHYRAIADASELPIMLYNVPSRTGVNMEAETVIDLSSHPNIIGIKDAAGDLTQAMRIIHGTHESFIFLSGEDTLTVPIISVGGDGVISVIGNVMPEQYSRVINSALEGRYKEASASMYPLLDFNEALFAEGNPVGVKTALANIGLCRKDVRLPLVAGSETLQNRLNSLYEDAVKNFEIGQVARQATEAKKNLAI
ncbi:4-hydroxy-tetrahydrodipicolinate synthase [Sediminitomix flava]|uniref:4-hydroxy-tetrahydrodipicolinate synthase n=1 Tax=Sediminitomix flava TaxID=379075 RepID=A0A315ZB08_SEDFL|nr:4-hydroxy-tetrahydrodipicolinate synthase [Sediminitomix flava]PWJ42540.1 4-hydroxy-tetrahydrodipicolinate synthase [Sediminitomix flava]